MRWLIRSLYAVWMLTLAGCATRIADTPPCGVSHVEASDRGLKVFFGTDANEIPSNGFRAGGLTVNRAGSHVPSKRYAIKNGRLKGQFQLISSRYLVLNVGDSAGTFNGFGGCFYEVKVDKDGPYLDVNGTAGDLDLSSYVAWYRPGKETGQYWIPGP
jgi:hypothetical protein